MRGDSLPAFSNSLLHRIQVDQAGNLWVPSFQVGSTPAEKWTVFSGDGTWLGEVAGLPHLRILEIGLSVWFAMNWTSSTLRSIGSCTWTTQRCRDKPHPFDVHHRSEFNSSDSETDWPA